MFLTAFDSSGYKGMCLSLCSWSVRNKSCARPAVFAEKPLRDLEAWKRLWTLRTTGNIQRKTSPFTPALGPSSPHVFTGNGFGTRELEKGQRWVREKHRWLSDGLGLNDPDSPTQSQHLRGYFQQTSVCLTGHKDGPTRKKGLFYKQLSLIRVLSCLLHISIIVFSRAGYK